MTADHGNADEMLTPDGKPQTAHSLNPVPFVVTVPGIELADGGSWPTWPRRRSRCSGSSSRAAMKERSLLK